MKKRIVLVGVVLIAVLMVSFVTYSLYSQSADLQRQIDKLQAENNQLKNQTSTLQNQINQLLGDRPSIMWPLNIYFNSPLNQTYHTNVITLNVTIMEIDLSVNNTVRKATYSLDGQENVTLPLLYQGITDNNGNALPHSVSLGITDLPPLSDGTHTVTVFGEYDFDYGSGRILIVTGNVTATFVITTT